MDARHSHLYANFQYIKKKKKTILEIDKSFKIRLSMSLFKLL